MLVLLSSGALVGVFFAVMLYLIARTPSPVEPALKAPSFRLLDLFRWDGTIDRGPYATTGLILFAVKHNLDRIVAGFGFGKPWSIYQYWVPSKGFALQDLGRQDYFLFATLLVLALPFIWAGVALSLRRLRAAGMPTWLVFLFFVPIVNLVLFVELSLTPSKADASRAPADRRPGFLSRIVPRDPLGSTAVAIALSLPLAIAAACLSTLVLKQYGWGLFVGIPFCQGMMAALLYSYHEPRTLGSCVLVSCFACLLTGAALAAFAIEGVFCLAMAFPFALALTVMGGAVGWCIQRNVWSHLNRESLLLALIAFLPLFMGAEFAAKPEPPVWAVRTALDIQAPPEVVWRNVVAFTEIPPPTEWFFRGGLAYPMRAVIDGRGPGAVRHCVFSTGEFVEPIERWEEPRLLKFSVSKQPASMQEWSLYGTINAPHLQDYLVSQGGQFLLTPLSGGGTRLEGTTWYRDYIWPAFYWRLWSDLIIHRIHTRVLRHIRENSERQPRAGIDKRRDLSP